MKPLKMHDGEADCGHRFSCEELFL